MNHVVGFAAEHPFVASAILSAAMIAAYALPGIVGRFVGNFFKAHRKKEGMLEEARSRGVINPRHTVRFRDGQWQSVVTGQVPQDLYTPGTYDTPDGFIRVFEDPKES